ncbi:MAG: hypothetical protein ABIT20_21500 [Gemmatimonadaceae bacterium]
MKKRREPAPLILSIVIHVAVAFAILNAAFHYDFSQPLTQRSIQPKEEQVTYVTARPSGGVTGGADTTSAPALAKTPLRGLVAPVTTPTSLPPVPDAGGQPGGVDGGRGRASEAVSATTGIVPGDVDPRLARDPHEFFPAPKTHAERVDSAVRASIFAYNDSVARARGLAGKQPGDWTFEKNGQKWGIDGNKIYLGKFAIPSAVLAALPLRIQGNPGEAINDRLVTTRRADLLLHADAAFHDDEFKTAVKRIRERKDKERKEKATGDADKPVASNPDIVP